MAGIVKNVVRLGVIGTLAGGTALVVAGPDRIGALFNQVRGSVNCAIDRNIDDPIALRAQLKALEGEYPERISEVQHDLGELTRQIAQLEREREVSHRAAAIAEEDFGTMQTLLTRADEARGSDGSAIVRVRFGERTMDVDSAFAKANEIAELRNGFVSRAADIERDLGYLSQQESRLTDLLAQLEGEQATFQTQLWQLDRQVDSIARNERLIEIMAKRQETIDEHSRYRAASLDQLHARFSDIRAKQESQLQSLSRATEPTRYEDRAKMQLDTELGARELYQDETGGGGVRGSRFVAPAVIEVRPRVIEIGPDSGQDEDKQDEGRIVSRVD